MGFSKPTSAALSSYINKLPYREGQLWVSKTGFPLKNRGIQSIFRRLKVIGGDVRWSPHTMRVTFAINFLRAGGDVFSLQTLGGWTDLDMPSHYTAALKAEDALRAHRNASPVERS